MQSPSLLPAQLGFSHSGVPFKVVNLTYELATILARKQGRIERPETLQPGRKPTVAGSNKAFCRTAADPEAQTLHPEATSLHPSLLAEDGCGWPHPSSTRLAVLSARSRD